MLRRPLRLVLRPLLLVLALAWVPFAVFTAVDVDVWWPIVALVAFMAYAVVLTLLVAAISLALGARVVALVAIAGAAVLIVPRAGWVTADEQPTATGERLVVATANVRFGKADPDAILRLVSRERIDVLALQEDTPGITSDLAAGGLRRALPYGTLQPGGGARGVSVYSRYPMTAVPRQRGDRRSVGGVVALPDGRTLHVRSVHPFPPHAGQARFRDWETSITSLLRTIRTVPAPALLLGDFNATLDHRPLRTLLGAGLRDAADERGNAWRPTWTNGRWAALPLDHILVPPSVAVRGVEIHDLAGSDHDLVTATIQLRR